jgi:hypothetical protein
LGSDENNCSTDLKNLVVVKKGASKLNTTMSHKYTPLPTTVDEDMKPKSATQSVIALTVLSLCAGSAAVYSSMNTSSNVQSMQMSYTATCLQNTGPVLGGYDLVRISHAVLTLFLLILTTPNPCPTSIRLRIIPWSLEPMACSGHQTTLPPSPIPTEIRTASTSPLKPTKNYSKPVPLLIFPR